MKNLKNINHSHCEPQAWQSHKANTIFEKESETPLTAVGTLTALLRNSTKVVENLLQKVTLCKVLSISVITLFFSLIATAESLAETTCSWSGTTLTVGGTGTFNACPDGSQKNAEKIIIENGVTSIGNYAFYGTQIPNCSLSELDKCHLPCTNGTFWNGTACVAISCPAGKYLDGSECKTCAAGSYSAAGDNVCSQC